MPPPPWAWITLLIALIVDLSFAQPPPQFEGLYAILLVVSTLAAIRLAIWWEGEIYGRLLGRGVFFKLAVMTLVFPAFFAGALVGGLAKLLLSGSVVSASILLGTLWFVGAAAGTMLVIVFDHMGRGLVSRFHERILLVASGLMAVAGTLSVTVLMVVPKWVEKMLDKPDGMFVTLSNQDQGSLEDVARNWEANRPEFLASFDFPEMLAASVAIGVFFLFLPSFLSAASKLAELAMEQVHPVAVALQRVAEGDRNIRVEEGGSVEFRKLTREFNHMVDTLDMAERMERAFGAYVSTPVLEQIRQQHGQVNLPPSAREATVFFADLRGFTAMSEQLSPEQVMSMLNRYYGHVLEVVAAYEGYIDKFIGDAVYVVFNGPIDQPDHVTRGTECALAVQEKVTILNEAGLFPEVDGLRVGIGVATGPVVAGSLGTERATQFSVVGDTVNLASRLSDHAPAGQVWVSEATAHALPSNWVSVPVESIAVKGKTEPVQPYRVTSVVPRPSPPPKVEDAEESPLQTAARVLRDRLESFR